MLAELKQCFLEAYDDNNDGKIDIREVKTITNIFFCYLFGIHLHLLQKKTLSAFGYSSYYIYTSKKSKGKKKPTPLFYRIRSSLFHNLGYCKKFFHAFSTFFPVFMYSGSNPSNTSSECISCILEEDVIERRRKILSSSLFIQHLAWMQLACFKVNKPHLPLIWWICSSL